MNHSDREDRRVRKPFVKPELRKEESWSLKSRTAGFGGHRSRGGFHGGGSWPLPGCGGAEGGS